MSCALWSSAVPLLLAVGPGSARLMRRAVAPPRQPARWSLLPHSMRLAWQRAHLFPLTRSVQRLSGWRDQHRGHAVRLHPVCGLHQRNDGTAYSGGAAPRVLPVRPPPLPGLASTWPLRAWALSHPCLDDRAVPPGRRGGAAHRCPGLAQPHPVPASQGEGGGHVQPPAVCHRPGQRGAALPAGAGGAGCRGARRPRQRRRREAGTVFAGLPPSRSHACAAGRLTQASYAAPPACSASCTRALCTGWSALRPMLVSLGSPPAPPRHQPVPAMPLADARCIAGLSLVLRFWTP